MSGSSVRAGQYRLLSHGYRWIVLASAVGMNLSMGINYSWSIYKKTLVEDLGWTNVEASWPYSIYALIFSLTMTLGGRLQDRFGPRAVATVGAICAGTGYVACSLVNGLWPLLMAYSLAAVGNSFCHATTIPTANKWFPIQRRGIVTGTVMGAVSMASFVLAPISAWLIGSYGLKTTFLILGLVIMAFLLVLAQFMGNPLTNKLSESPQQAKGGPVKTISMTVHDYTWLEMLATGRFYQLWFVFVVSCSAGLMIIGHVATIAKDQAQWEYGFYVVMMMAFFNTLGRLFAGFLSDRYGRLTMVFIVLFVQFLNMCFFSHYNTPLTVLVGSSLTGFCYGAGMSLFPLLSVDFYGLKNAGVNYGLLYSAMGVAGIFGPVMAAWSVDETSSYQLAYRIIAGLLVISLVFVWLIKRQYSAHLVAKQLSRR